MGRGFALTLFVWSDLVPRRGWQQMAIDRALAERAADGTSVIRIYRWAGDTISLGANEAALRTWDRERLEDAGLVCVRRPTGGRAVWHDAADLTYAVTAPLAAWGGLAPAYRSIHERLAVACQAVGLDATLAPKMEHPPGLTPGACFDAAVGGEVIVSGRKMIGSAQRVVGPAFLQHGAIALEERGPRLARFRLDSALGPTPEGDPTRPPEVTPERLAEAIVSTWLAAGGTTISEELSAWAEAASAKHTDHYRDAAWTWRR